MVTYPRLVGVILRRRSNWKPVAETDLFVLQHHPRQESKPYRIITRGFPHYRVAEGDDIGVLRDELTHLSKLARSSIQGKITSKKIATWLKGPCTPPAISPPGDQLQQDEEDEELQDEDGYLSDLSTLSNEEMTETYSPEPNGRMMRRAISLEDMKKSSSLHRLLQEDHPQRPASSASTSLAVPSNTLSPHHHERQYSQYPDLSLSQHEDNYTLYNYNDKHNHHDMTGTTEGDHDDLMSYDSREPHRHVLDDGKSARSIYTSPSLREYQSSRIRTSVETTLSRDEQRSNGLLGWFQTSPIFDAVITWVEGPANHATAPKKNEKPNPIMDIPFQFIALLTYPEPDPRNGNKMTLAMVRETSFVRQRRKTLLILTAYTVIVRYCSFDFFLVILFVSNCGMLFLMKNSGRMNVNMAKRAVNQRVGWAKQWAGGIFRRNGGLAGSSVNNQGNSNDLRTQQQLTASSNISTSKPPHREKIEIAQEDNPQTKKRGLFGKRRTTNIVSSTAIAQSGTVGSTHAPLADGVSGGDEPQPSRTSRRGFFKRNTATAPNRSATTPPSTSIALSAGPIIPSPALASPPTETDGSNNDPFRNALTPPTALSPSTLGQIQPLPQFQLLPPRSPSPSASRRDISWTKPWGTTSPPALQQNADSPPSSAPVSTSASPIAASASTPTPQQSGRSLASINPRSFLSGFTQSQKQQQQQQHSVSAASPSSKTITSVIPISPQPVNVTNLPTPILANDQNHMDILAPSGVILFEGEEIGESALDCIFPVSKFSSSPEALSLASFPGTPCLTTEEENGRQDYILSKDGLLDPSAF